MSETAPYRPDPLADGFGVAPGVGTASGQPPVAPVPPAMPVPDPRHDRHLAFPETTPAAGASAPPPPEASTAPAAGGAPSPWRAPTGRRTSRRRGPGRWWLLVAAIFLGPSILGSIGSVVGSEGTDEPSPLRDPKAPIQGQPVDPVPRGPIEAPPTDAQTMRFEVDGPGRTPTIRIYGGSDDEEQEDVSLPFAVERPIPERGSFLVSASDYDNEDASPLQCRIYVDDVLVSLSTGYRSVSCDLSVSQLPRSTDGAS